jgi:ABC-type transporter Mla MlaB component
MTTDEAGPLAAGPGFGPGRGPAAAMTAEELYPDAAAAMTAEELYPDADWLNASALTGCAGLRLTGEADMHTAEILQKALAELPSDAAEIHLELAGLEFIDVAAARHLAALAEQPGRPTLILHEPPSSLILLIRLLWPGSRLRICCERAVPRTRVSGARRLAAGTLLPGGGHLTSRRLTRP